MDRELCFYIEGNQLYLEQVLVEYNDIPIFFVCRDTAAHYVVLCSDLEEFRYMVVKAANEDLFRLLHGTLSMRDIFLIQKNYWEIISGEEIQSDSVAYKPVELIDGSLLPEESAYFEILTDEVLLYVQKYDNWFLAQDKFQELQQILNSDEKGLNEYIDTCALSVESFVELYEGCFRQEIAAGIQVELDYEKNVDDMQKLTATLSVRKKSKDWKEAEICILAYAA